MGNCSSCCKGTLRSTLTAKLIDSEKIAHKTSGRPKDGLYEPALADSEREAVADLLQYLENVRISEGALNIR